MRENKALKSKEILLKEGGYLLFLVLLIWQMKIGANISLMAIPFFLTRLVHYVTYLVGKPRSMKYVTSMVSFWAIVATMTFADLQLIAKVTEEFVWENILIMVSSMVLFVYDSIMEEKTQETLRIKCGPYGVQRQGFKMIGAALIVIIAILWLSGCRSDLTVALSIWFALLAIFSFLRGEVEL